MAGSNTKAPTAREYDGIVLFNYAPGLKFPFKFFRRECFDPSEIREAYYLFQLVPQSRKKKLKSLKGHPGNSLSIFAKTEKGAVFILSKQIFRENILRLNLIFTRNKNQNNITMRSFMEMFYGKY